MLRKYIQTREIQDYARDTNRKSLDFDWGVEYVGLPGGVNAGAAMEAFAEDAVANSDRFYQSAGVQDAEFDGSILKFRSLVETPWPENNTVWGRFFGAGKDLAVIVLPQWNGKWDAQTKLCRMLQRAGITSLRLSLPFHHHRKPGHLERAEYLVSANIGRTLMAMRQAVLDTRSAADWLLRSGYRRVGIIGTSVGSCIGFLAFAHDPRIATGVFIHVSSYFADVVWHGLSTKHIKPPLEASINLDQLRTVWSPISPYPFIRRLERDDRKVLCISGRYDPTFLPELSQQTYAEFDRCGVRYESSWLHCGHYTMGMFPFNAVAAYRIIRFLNRT